MVKTIIADDDFLVRSYLKQLDSWERAGYCIIADVRDGEEALRVILEKSPEVLITDISMPLMGGIELIKEIRKNNKEIYIIVLSCHDEFQYVKEAMKFGADEYILKTTLNENTLYEMLKNVENQMKNRHREKIEKDRNDKLIQMGRHSFKYHFFNALLAGNLSEEEMKQKKKDAGVTAKFVNNAVINIFIPNWNELKGTYQQLELEQYSQYFLHILIQQLEELLGSEKEQVEVIYLGEGVFCLFLDFSEMRRNSIMKQRLTSVATVCFHCCKGEPYTFVIGVSNICFGEDGIRQAYQQAREMIKLSFYEKDSILYFDSQPTISRELPNSAAELLKNITSFVDERNYCEMEKSFSSVIEDCRKSYIENKVILHWLKELDQKVKIERTLEEYASIIKIDQLLLICKEYKEKLFMGKKKEMPQGSSPVIHRVVDYLHEHFREQIGLSEAAGEAGLNSAYLSYLFKQEIGIGFSNYLLELRMEYAKSLLKSTNRKVKEIAIESGFNDYHYFSKAFKKLFSCSPADYRKKESET